MQPTAASRLLQQFRRQAGPHHGLQHPKASRIKAVARCDFPGEVCQTVRGKKIDPLHRLVKRDSQPDAPVRCSFRHPVLPGALLRIRGTHGLAGSFQGCRSGSVCEQRLQLLHIPSEQSIPNPSLSGNAPLEELRFLHPDLHHQSNAPGCLPRNNNPPEKNPADSVEFRSVSGTQVLGTLRLTAACCMCAQDQVVARAGQCHIQKPDQFRIFPLLFFIREFLPARRLQTGIL